MIVKIVEYGFLIFCIICGALIGLFLIIELVFMLIKFIKDSWE